MYSGVFSLPIPKEASIISFAVDLVTAVTAKLPTVLQVYTTEAVRSAMSWLKSVGLTVADEKIEAVIITKEGHIQGGSGWIYGHL